MKCIFIEINVENIDLKQSIKNTLNIYWLQVSEFLRMMMMFGGIGPGTPDVFRTINPDPHKVVYLFVVFVILFRISRLDFFCL